MEWKLQILLKSVTSFSLVLWVIFMFTMVIVTIFFQLIYHVHRYLDGPYLKPLSIWEIPLQTFESLVEFRMVNFFGPNLPSAKLLRGSYILFGTFMVMAYNSNLRAALLAVEGDGVIDTFEVRRRKLF